MWNVKYRPPKNLITGISFLKRDKQFDSFEEATQRADCLMYELEEGTEILVCDGDFWIEKYMIHNLKGK